MTSTRQLERRLYRLILADRYLFRGQPSQSPRFAERERLVAELQARSPYQQARPARAETSIDSHGFGRDDFLAATAHHTRPIVIRGFARSFPATRTWTERSLAQRLGNRTCAVVEFDETSAMRAWDTGVGFAQMPFDEYLRRMTDEDLYLNNSTELVKACPELLADLQLDALSACFTDPTSTWDELLTTNFFIGSRRVRSSIHAAFGGNFFVQIAGRKRWRFIDPAHSAYLHPVTARPFQYVRSACGGFYRCEQNQPGADHIFARLPHYEVVLEPGDLLYNAPWWWHEVDNLDDFTVGCAVRHFPTPLRSSPSWSNHRLFTLTSTYPASRALMFGHFLRHLLTGDQRPLRTYANDLMLRMLYRSFRGARRDVRASTGATGHNQSGRPRRNVRA